MGGRDVRKNSGPRVNEEIRSPKVRLLRDLGEPIGVVYIDEARRIAQDEGLDLVEISPNADPPVVKLIDYGKFRYQLQKKANEAKKKQAVIDVKEIKFRPNIDSHDLEVKLRKAKEFVDDGDKIKLIMQFRGREMAHFSTGMVKFKTILNSVLEYGAVVESEPKALGTKIIAVVAAAKKAK